MVSFDEYKFSNKEIEKAAMDARIKATTEEISAMTDELNARLKRILELQEVDTEGIVPLVNPLDLSYTLVQREDHVDDGNHETELMARAPKSQKNYYIVPQVIGD